MSPLADSRNVAARMGRWSATHKKTAIFGWLAFVAAAFMIGNVLGTKQLDPDKAGSGESGRVDAIISDEYKQKLGDTVLIQSTKHTVDDPAFKAAISDTATTLANVKTVGRVHSPYEPGNAGQISSDRHSALVSVELRTTDDKRAEKLDVPVQKEIASLVKEHPSVTIEEFGVNSTEELDKAVKDDFAKAGILSLPVTLGILLVAFGALVAAGLPLLARAHRRVRDDGPARDPPASSSRSTRTSA